MPPVAQLGRSLIAPAVLWPLVLICAVGLGQRAVQPPPDRCLFTLFLLSPFFLLLENRERRKVGRE